MLQPVPDQEADQVRSPLSSMWLLILVCSAFFPKKQSNGAGEEELLLSWNSKFAGCPAAEMGSCGPPGARAGWTGAAGASRGGSGACWSRAAMAAGAAVGEGWCGVGAGGTCAGEVCRRE